MATTANATTETMLMNPATGSVATIEEWKADFESMTAEEWGGQNFEDAGLVEVIWKEESNDLSEAE